MSDRAPRNNVVPYPRAAAPKPAHLIFDPFRPESAGQIDGPPPPPHWLVDGILLPGTVTLFAGASKSGKSLATLQMLTAVALGTEWMGRQTEQARCLAIMCEDTSERVRSRILAICEHYEVHNSVLENELQWDSRPHRESAIWETEFGKGKPTLLWEQIFGGENLGYDQCAMALDSPRVLLLDTAMAMFAIDHNKSHQVNPAVRALAREAIKYNCAIVVNIHSSRSNKESYGGSGQWEAAARGGFNLSRPKPPPGVEEEEMQYGDAGLQRVFRGMGANYVEMRRPDRWRMKDGVFVLDDMATDDRPRQKRQGPLTETEKTDLYYRLLLGVKRTIQHGGIVVADVASAKSMPNRARRFGADDVRHASFNNMYDAQTAMLELGQLVLTSVGGVCCIRPPDMRYRGEDEWKL